VTLHFFTSLIVMLSSTASQAARRALARALSGGAPTGTPAATRLSVLHSAYGHSFDEAEEGAPSVDTLKAAYRKPAPVDAPLSKVHSRRALFDSDLTHSNDAKSFSDVAKMRSARRELPAVVLAPLPDEHSIHCSAHAAAAWLSCCMW
jgi:hypothetical protein